MDCYDIGAKTDLILLDEPTTYLDMAHQVEILDLLFDLNDKEGRTVVMVLHDLNLACRYAHHIVAVRNKQVYAQGKPEVVTEEMVQTVFIWIVPLLKTRSLVHLYVCHMARANSSISEIRGGRDLLSLTLSAEETSVLLRDYRLAIEPAVDATYSLYGKNLLDNEQALDYLQKIAHFFQSPSILVTASLFAKRYSVLTIASAFYAMSRYDKGLHCRIENMWVEAEYAKPWLPTIRLIDRTVSIPTEDRENGVMRFLEKSLRII